MRERCITDATLDRTWCRLYQACAPLGTSHALARRDCTAASWVLSCYLYLGTSSYVPGIYLYLSSLIEEMPTFIHSYLGQHQRPCKALLVTRHHAASLRHGFESNPPLRAACLIYLMRCFRDHRTIWVFHSEECVFSSGEAREKLKRQMIVDIVHPLQ